MIRLTVELPKTNTFVLPEGLELNDGKTELYLTCSPQSRLLLAGAYFDSSECHQILTWLKLLSQDHARKEDMVKIAMICNNTRLCAADLVLNGLHFKECLLQNVMMTRIDFNSCIFEDCSFSGCELAHTKFISCPFMRARFETSSFRHCIFDELKFTSEYQLIVDVCSFSWCSFCNWNPHFYRLSNTVISSSIGLHRYAALTFKGFGEADRIISAMQPTPDSQLTFYCGCFVGSEEQLRNYIANSSKVTLAKSRLLALDVLKKVLELQQDEKELPTQDPNNG